MAKPIRLILSLTGLLLVGGAATWWWRTHHQPTTDPASPGAAPTGGAGNQRRGGMGGGPAAVLVATASEADVPVTRNSIGTITSLVSVTLRAQIAGRLDLILFTEGQVVQAGDLLADIDARPFILAQAQYEGQLQRDKAQLRQAELDLTRYRTLVEQDSLARQQLDTQTALVAQLTGAVATDQAQVDTAKLNQTYCHVVAPVAGRLGMRLVDAGNYVSPGDASGLVTITQTTPISVAFTVPEVDLPLVVERVRSQVALPVVVLGRDGTTRLGMGSVTSIDNAIDASTGTLRLRATLPNEDESLFPNQFVNVRLILERHHAAVAIPVPAVQRGPDGAYVWAVADNVAHQHLVKLGVQSGDLVEIMEGIAAGDQVVVDGVDRIKDGAAVAASAAAAGRPGRTGGGQKGERHGGSGGQGGWHKPPGDANSAPRPPGPPSEGQKPRQPAGE